MAGFLHSGHHIQSARRACEPGGSDYQLLLRDIDAIGVQLKKFQDAGVPVIWRPLHEAGKLAVRQRGLVLVGQPTGPTASSNFGGSCTTADSPTPSKFPGLHNLIWEFTSSAAEGNYLNWYPGDDVVDMIGLDIYTDPASSMSGEWYDVLAQYNGRKMIALSESGTLPNASAMETYNIDWRYFSLWQDGFLDDFTAQQVQTLLNDNDIITLNELPTLPWSNSAPIAGDYNRQWCRRRGRLRRVAKSKGQTGWGLAADSDLNGRIDAADYAFWRSRLGQSGSGTASAVPEPTALLLIGVVILLASISERRLVSPDVIRRSRRRNHPLANLLYNLRQIDGA